MDGVSACTRGADKRVGRLCRLEEEQVDDDVRELRERLLFLEEVDEDVRERRLFLEDDDEDEEEDERAFLRWSLKQSARVWPSRLQ